MKNVSLFMMAAILVLVLSGCASKQSSTDGSAPVQSLAPASESNVRIAAIETVIVDWMGRTANAPAIPQWIQDIQLNRFASAANFLGEQNTGVGGSIYRGLTISGSDLRGAQMQATAQFAREIARELHQQINVYLADSASQSMNNATRQAIQERTQVVSEVQISGARQIAEFWQEVIVTDALSGRRSQQIQLYRLYGFQSQDWAAITAGYVQRVLDGLPQRLQPEERDVREMMQFMLNSARHPIEMSQQERVAQLEAQQRMLDAQINLMPAQQRDAARIELARINSETAITMSGQRADASVARTDAIAASNAERAAYASGNPVLIGAAGITPADAALVNAARIAANLIF